MSKVKGLYIFNYKGNVHGTQSLMIVISSLSSCVSGFAQIQWGRRDNTTLHRQKLLLSFQNDHFLYFLTIKALWFEE